MASADVARLVLAIDESGSGSPARPSLLRCDANSQCTVDDLADSTWTRKSAGPDDMHADAMLAWRVDGGVAPVGIKALRTMVEMAFEVTQAIVKSVVDAATPADPHFEVARVHLAAQFESERKRLAKCLRKRIRHGRFRDLQSGLGSFSMSLAIPVPAQVGPRLVHRMTCNLLLRAIGTETFTKPHLAKARYVTNCHGVFQDRDSTVYAPGPEDDDPQFRDFVRSIRSCVDEEK